MTTNTISIASERCHRLPITLSKDYFILDEGDIICYYKSDTMF